MIERVSRDEFQFMFKGTLFWLPAIAAFVLNEIITPFAVTSISSSLFCH